MSFKSGFKKGLDRQDSQIEPVKRTTPTQAFFRSPKNTVGLILFTVASTYILALWVENRNGPGYLNPATFLQLLLGVTLVTFGGISLELRLLTWVQKITLEILDSDLAKRDHQITQMLAEIEALKKNQADSADQS